MLCATGPFKSVGSAGNRLSTGSSTTGIFASRHPCYLLVFRIGNPQWLPTPTLLAHPSSRCKSGRRRGLARSAKHVNWLSCSSSCSFLISVLEPVTANTAPINGFNPQSLTLAGSLLLLPHGLFFSHLVIAPFAQRASGRFFRLRAGKENG
jgi:hypothetical protein